MNNDRAGIATALYVHIYIQLNKHSDYDSDPTCRKDSVDEALLCKKNFSFLHNNASSTLYVFPTSWVSACLIVYIQPFAS